MLRPLKAPALLRLGTAGLLAVLALPAAAECVPPGAAPTLPDGATATMGQMKEAHPLVEAYVRKMQAYRNCIEDAIKAIPQGTVTAEKVQKMRDAGGDALNQAKTFSDNYDAQILAFKAKGRAENPPAKTP